MIISALFIAAGLSFLLTGLTLRFALRAGLLDIPNARSSHQSPVPRGGGIGVVVVVLLAGVALLCSGRFPVPSGVTLVGGGLAIALVGLWDDLVGVSPFVRLTVHLAVSLWVMATIELQEPTMVYWILAAILMTWVTNLYNFMDGIDGLAGIEAVFVGFASAFLLFQTGNQDVALFAGIIGSASLGFIFWNWPPARIFMGDVGSGFLGFFFAGLAAITHSAGLLAIWSWLILLGVFLVDATLTLWRRLLRGDRIYEAHRNHAYQRAARRFGSHKGVTLSVAVLDVLWLFPLAWFVAVNPEWGMPVTAIAWCPLVLIGLWLGAGRTDGV